MAISLKISNIFGNELELIQRLKKVNSPGKKVLLNGLATGDWNVVYKELLFRIELYAEAKVLNYTRQDLNTIVSSTRKVGIDAIVEELVRKTLPVHIQEAIPQQFVDHDVTFTDWEFQEGDDDELPADFDLKKYKEAEIKSHIDKYSYFEDFSTEEYSNELLFKSDAHSLNGMCGKTDIKEANKLVNWITLNAPAFSVWVEEMDPFVEVHVDLTGQTLRNDLSN